MASPVLIGNGSESSSFEILGIDLYIILDSSFPFNCHSKGGNDRLSLLALVSLFAGPGEFLGSSGRCKHHAETLGHFRGSRKRQVLCLRKVILRVCSLLKGMRKKENDSSCNGINGK